ncbi:NADH-quinone oxidoreductase subunit NuoN [Ponticaulis sp.]|uniref:NADH-quinone oxidoreductase subunit NuoN n=1 Tax=Ponticaulis sp. TaxID=2020902 RepID=UPI000B696665|nr:NADH-quinone oxidoreductase subunit NuoN [Ponticaulis sp.]MAI89455.1 NADH-quinone oxidoreductase subunit NuoN [Ponticaulis sp.]OUY00492.1 MAG: NADH-quinone oxidoreductase subunit N [Hyphomonadaceae bacterium TMED5]|tara:strand:- start:104717 stop:106135 length:1419 start_codon:yes stop_codon:yes gene_type:complete
MNWSEICAAATPEFYLAIVGLIAVLLGAILREKFTGISLKFSAVVLLGAAILSVLNLEGGTAFNGLWETDAYTNIAKAVCYFCTAIALLLAESYLFKEKLIRFEYCLLVIFASLGMGIMLSANDLMTLYLGIETLGLSSYVLAAFNRDSQRSSEAGLKYFVLGSIASGLILYGASLVYGFSGSTNYDLIAEAEMGLGLMFGLVLLVTGLAFKVSAAPLHVWTPDVYEGAPTPVVTFFASAPKLAAMVVFATILFDAFGSAIDQWQDIILIISGASMLIGAFGALRQNNMKRILAYSSIGNMGYALIALAAGEEIGGPALLVYMVIYALSQLGIFGVLLSMRRRGGMVEDISELSGLSTTMPWLAVCMTALIFSVAGIPPLGGFFGKLVVFQAGVEAGLWPIVVIGVVSSVISLGYYLRIIMIMWGGDKLAPFENMSGTVRLAVTGATLLVFPVFTVLIGWMMSLVGGSFSLG